MEPIKTSDIKADLKLLRHHAALTIDLIRKLELQVQNLDAKVNKLDILLRLLKQQLRSTGIDQHHTR